MKKYLVPVMWLPSMFLIGSCSSEEIRTEQNPFTPTPETVTLRFKLGANTFTRADEEGNEVENIQLVFYRSNSDSNGSALFLQKVSAEKDVENDIYTADVEIIPNKEPDIFVAFVNLPSDAAIPTQLDGNSLIANEITSSEGNLLMSTPRYFDGSHNDISFQTFDYTSTEPITIELERLAAKVNVSKNSDANAFPPIAMYDAEGKKTSLNLNLTGWGLNCIDKGTYLIRQIDSFNEMNTLLAAWSGWYDSTNKTLNWSKSLNYSVNSVDPSNTDKIDFITFKDANNQFGEDFFSHETTRALTVTSNPNSKPSIVLKGYYTIGEDDQPKTFYRVRNSIFKEDELWEYFNKNISKKIKINGAVPTVEEAKKFFEFSRITEFNGKPLPSSYISLQVKKDFDQLPEITYSDGEVPDTENLNSTLKNLCGPVEKFNNGSCLFTVPIEHQTFGENTLYGLVRNHYYQVSINHISGLGNGVMDDNQIVVEDPVFEDEDSSYTVSFKLHIREWTDVIQNVEIKKN